jgi:hypothetical protein
MILNFEIRNPKSAIRNPKSEMYHPTSTQNRGGMT